MKSKSKPIKNMDDSKEEDKLQDIKARIPPNWGKWISVGAGWHPIILKLHKEILEIFPDYEVQQVKEKFGGLRYYCSYDGEERVHRLITKAEQQAEKTCEICGAPAILKTRNGWLKTICDSCDSEKEYKPCKDEL